VFNNLSDWTDSPMLKGADPSVMRGLAEAMHRAWIAFIRTGKPDHAGLPPWPVYRREDRMTMRFDTVIDPVSDLAGLNWRQPWLR
jgi:para-nitrobenzyl esterase